MRKKIVAGNWKMNKTLGEALLLTAEVMSLASSAALKVQVVLGVPFPYLLPVKNQLGENSAVAVAAQNCSDQSWGAFTGEVSAPMLRSMNIPIVILGHSERRQYFGENGALLAAKTTIALSNDLTPIFCCGEPLEIREQGTHENLVRQQIAEGLFHLSEQELKRVVIAYEPVWAIGTGKTATSAQAQEMHAVIRGQLATKYGKALADGISILYGGSVKGDNARELFACPDVDGGLVGGASLKAREFIDIALSA
jgi:triosephosphate isomerase